MHIFDFAIAQSQIGLSSFLGFLQPQICVKLYQHLCDCQRTATRAYYPSIRLKLWCLLYTSMYKCQRDSLPTLCKRRMWEEIL
jgi:hypothetical protein